MAAVALGQLLDAVAGPDRPHGVEIDREIEPRLAALRPEIEELVEPFGVEGEGIPGFRRENFPVDVVKPDGVVAEPGDPFDDAVDRIVRHEAVLVTEVDAEKADAPVRLFFEGELSVADEDAPVFAGGGVERAGEVERGAFEDGIAGVESGPAFSFADDEGFRSGGEHPLRRERDAGDHPDGVGGRGEGDSPGGFTVESESGGVDADPFAVAVIAEGDRGVVEIRRAPPVAAVTPGDHRDALCFSVRIIHGDFSDGVAEFRGPCRGVEQIEPAPGVCSGKFDRLRRRNLPEFRIGDDDAAFPAVCGRIDHLVGDAGKFPFSGRHGTEVVVRPLIAPAASAVVGGFIAEAHIGRLPDVDRGGFELFQCDGEGEFRLRDCPLRPGRIEADGEVVLPVLPVVLNADAEVAAKGNPVFAVLEAEGAGGEFSRFERDQLPELCRENDLLAIRFDRDLTDGSRQRQNQRQHGGADRPG